MSQLTQYKRGLAIATAGVAMAGALAVAGTTGAAARPGVARETWMARQHGQAAPARESRGSRHHSLGTTFYNWPMFGAGPPHFGVSPETAIGVTTAPSLTAGWTANLGTPGYASPAVATISALGKALVYDGGGNHVYAYPASGGAPLWSYKVASGVVVSSPAVYAGVVYFGTTTGATGTLYAVNASTGALVCSFNTARPILASPVVVNAPDGSGPVVYDGTVPGSSGGAGAEWAIYGVGNKHGACTEAWQFTAFAVAPGGSWSSPAYAKDANGVPLVVFGSRSSDDSVYALNASTGALVWRYQTDNVVEHDVGTAPTISWPGLNGFADGVVYVTGKDKIVYALDLTTGKLIWQHALVKGTSRDVSGTALVGNRIYLGSDTGVYALNAITGALVWHVLPGAIFYATPAVTGPPGQQVLLIGDTTGNLYALNLATGATVWTQRPASGFNASPAVSQGAVYVLGLDGVLRSFAPLS